MQKLDFLYNLLENEDEDKIPSLSQIDYGQLEEDIIKIWDHMYDTKLAWKYVDAEIIGAVLAFKFGFYEFAILTDGSELRVTICDRTIKLDRMTIQVIPNFSQLPRQLAIVMHNLLDKIRERKDMMRDIEKEAKKLGFKTKYRTLFVELELRSGDLNIGPNGYTHTLFATVMISKVLKNFNSLRYTIELIDEHGDTKDEYVANDLNDALNFLRDNNDN